MLDQPHLLEPGSIVMYGSRTAVVWALRNGTATLLPISKTRGARHRADVDHEGMRVRVSSGFDTRARLMLVQKLPITVWIQVVTAHAKEQATRRMEQRWTGAGDPGARHAV